MKVAIANPIYDTVFKFMMEDNAVARLLVSSIIGEKIITLEAKPQERSAEKLNVADGTSSLTVYRLDFSARIETPEGEKLVIIEMQKASFPTDIQRFRRYLGRQYADEGNLITDSEGNSTALRIYSIYFLGKDLGICDTPVLGVFPEIRDVATGEIVEKRSSFVEALSHKCWIVQISCLKQRRRNDLEVLLSVFDQANRSSDVHILNVSEEDFPEDYRHLIRRLKMAASSVEVQEQMMDEDGIVNYIKGIERSERSAGRKEGHKEGRKEVARKGLKMGMSTKDIIELTGLTEEEIEELRTLDLRT
jgi:predicted transposase/invertase (TIGR01784 family)